jgi:hypothetical protein
MNPEGTYACPICGCATPHAHSEEQIAEWRLEELKENLRSFCMYCRGEVASVQSEPYRQSNGFYLHQRIGQRYNDPACEARWPLNTIPAQQIEAQIADAEKRLEEMKGGKQ